MYSFKGFVTIPTLVSNVDSTTSAVGELSAYSSTFSTEIKTYTVEGSGTSVQCFKSYSSTTGTNVQAPVAISGLVARVAAWVHQRQSAMSEPDVVADFLLAFNSHFGGEINDASVSSMVNSINGRSYPSSITWYTPGYASESNSTKLWFSDAAFQQQYDEYELVVVPPVANIDSLHSDYSVVAAALSATTPSQVFTRIQQARAGKPETLLISQSYDFFNKNNLSVSIPTHWSVLVYGPRGNNEDLIRGAIVDYLSKNSGNSLTQWKTIFPDIFNVTEFIIVPMWVNYAIAPRTLTPGIYSQVCSMSAQLDYLKRTISSYPAVHVQDYAQTLPHPYYNLLLASIGHPENRGAHYRITDIFPDLISVSSTSGDFGRMGSQTQEWLTHISRMLVLAQTLTESTDIPVEYKKSLRDGVLYITLTYQDITYLVASKNSVPAS